MRLLSQTLCVRPQTCVATLHSSFALPAQNESMLGYFASGPSSEHAPVTTTIPKPKANSPSVLPIIPFLQPMLCLLPRPMIRQGFHLGDPVPSRVSDVGRLLSSRPSSAVVISASGAECEGPDALVTL